MAGAAEAGAGEAPAHALDMAALWARLGDGAPGGRSGLRSDEAARRQARFGPNRLPEPTPPSLVILVLGQLRSPLIYLLLAAAGLSIVLGDLSDSLFIFLVLAINTTIGTIQEARARANTAALRSAIATRTRVVRDGRAGMVPSADLVPGDIILLEAGDKVPADARLLEAADLQLDESALTGESLPVDKAAGGALPADTAMADRLTMLHAGTTAMRGRATALVVATGAATEIGRIAQALTRAPSPAPLTQKLDRFTAVLGLVALALVAALVAAGMLMGASLHHTFLLAVAFAVSVIPEGLPVAVTVALAVATRRMAARHVIVRALPAVEGLGACTVICTDKTGTLTLNQLTATCVYLPGHGLVQVEGRGLEVAGAFRGEDGPLAADGHAALARLGRAAALSNDASFDPARGAAGASGDTVDLAFLVLAAKAAVDVADLRARHPRIGEIPFSAERRLSAALHRHADEARLHVKGAAEVVVPLCAGIDTAAMLATAEALAAGGLRVLAVATRRLPFVPGAAPALEDGLHELELLGLVGFIDPLRPEARDAIAACGRAGVAVKMITGDHAATALAIARELGIADAPGAVVTGRELAALEADPAAEGETIARARVFARVEPRQKVRIVAALQRAGHVVAMTGDGVNDAPALRHADLGVAMGRGGTDVARDAADLVLADDHFASVVAGIEEGRAAYATIRKLVYLLLSTGGAEVVLFVLALATGLPVPLTTVQLLWLNLVTNGGQDVALALEPGEPGLLERPPRAPAEPLLDRLMVQESLLSGLFMGGAAYGLFAFGLAAGWGAFEARNVMLVLLVTFENVQVFNCRSESRSVFRMPLARNWSVVAAVVLAQAVHIGAAFVPGLSDVLEIAPITPGEWLALLPIALSLLVLMEAFKALRARSPAPAPARR